MKIKINATTNYDDDPNDLLAEYPQLADFGFTVEIIKKPKMIRIMDENGKYIQQICGYYDEHVSYINIDTLEELAELTRSTGMHIIFDARDEIPDIEIYDGYRE